MVVAVMEAVEAMAVEATAAEAMEATAEAAIMADMTMVATIMVDGAVDMITMEALGIMVVLVIMITLVS
uniref:Uncharacterized protein n=1 Tax=Panagrellus redivivus TaxID=6233 RepID=A0A7E4UXQ1_PANRE